MQRAEPMAPRAGSSRVSEVRADGTPRPRRPRRPRLPPSPRRQAVGQATSRPGWRAWAGCATRASSPPRSTTRRSASCWSASRWSRSAGAHCPTGSTARSSSDRIDEAAEVIRARLDGEPELAMPRLAFVLGSGLGGVVDLLEPAQRLSIPYRDIPHVPGSEVEGHAGELVIGRAGRSQRCDPVRPGASLRGLEPSPVDPAASRRPVARGRDAGAHQCRRVA